jgi:hypothetical protein
MLPIYISPLSGAFDSDSENEPSTIGHNRSFQRAAAQVAGIFLPISPARLKSKRLELNDNSSLRMK